MSKLSDFKSYTQNNDNKKKSFSEDDLKQKYDTYKDMSKEELNSQLLKEVARQKSQGTFDYNTLSSMVEGLKGSLPENDFNNIKRILESLK